MIFRSPLHRALFRSVQDLGPTAPYTLDLNTFWGFFRKSEAFDPFKNFLALIGYSLVFFVGTLLYSGFSVSSWNPAWMALYFLSLLILGLALAGTLGALALYWAHTMTELNSELTYFKEHSVIDHLSGLKNRRGFEDQIIAYIAAYRRGALRDIALLFLDIDHFKSINDTWGHAVGDEVIKAIAEFIERKHRGNDVSARWGGEEFVILAVGIGLDEAIRMADRIREGIAALDLRFDESRVPLTVSIGVTALRPEDSHEAFLERADSMLYEAKSSGRNCVKWAS